MTMDDVERVISLYRKHRTIRGVAGEIGKSRTYVHNRLLRAGVVDYSRPAMQGEKNPAAKLTKTQVSEIRASDPEQISAKWLAALHGISLGTIYRIRSKRSWKDD